MLNAQFSPKGKIWTKASKEPCMIDYLVEIERLGMFSVAKKFFSSVSIGVILGYVDESHSLSNPMKIAMMKLFSQRYREMEGYVKTK